MIENAEDAQTPLKDWRADPRTDEELLRAALTDEDEDLAWDAIAALHLRGSPETFEAARQLCASADANERRVGADILGQLGKDDGKFHEESVTILLDMLEHEQDPHVVRAVGVALGHRKDPRAIEPLARLKHHPEPCARFGVVYGLLGHEDELAINTLIDLSADPDYLVRDWATSGLGSMIEADTPEIRAALLARTTDEDVITRGEAMKGLAQRRDERVVEILITALESGFAGTGDGDRFSYPELEAVEELGDPRFYPVLTRLREEWRGDEDDLLYRLLGEAVEACQPHPED